MSMKFDDIIQKVHSFEMKKVSVAAAQDEAVLEAVANHTFGKKNMGNLAKILFVADKIEPGRPHVTQEYLERIEKKSLNELVCLILEENIDYLNKKGKSVSLITYKFLESVKEGEC